MNRAGDALEKAMAASHYSLFDRVCIGLAAGSLVYLAAQVAIAWHRGML